MALELLLVKGKTGEALRHFEPQLPTYGAFLEEIFCQTSAMTRIAIRKIARVSPYISILTMTDTAPSLKNVAARAKKATKIQGMVFTPKCV